MTEQELHEYFPGLSLMDFRLLCNIAYHGEIPGSYMISNFASRAKVSTDKVNETIARLRNTGYLQGTAVSPRYFFKVVKSDDGQCPAIEKFFQTDAAVPL